MLKPLAPAGPGRLPRIPPKLPLNPPLDTSAPPEEDDPGATPLGPTWVVPVWLNEREPQGVFDPCIPIKRLIIAAVILLWPVWAAAPVKSGGAGALGFDIGLSNPAAFPPQHSVCDQSISCRECFPQGPLLDEAEVEDELA